jgi:hypothetical protein
MHKDRSNQRSQQCKINITKTDHRKIKSFSFFVKNHRHRESLLIISQIRKSVLKTGREREKNLNK